MEKHGYMDTPLWDSGLDIEKRLDYLVGELSLEEKIHCLTTGCPDIERLGIKASYMGGEAAHGIEARHDQAFNAGEPEFTTSFTQPIGMSGSFDRELIRECGRVVGEEARALFTRNGGGGLCRWAPTIDMERDPRWGRTEEAYGEDPYLTGEMASAYIQGMKGSHPFYLQCGATLKHFYANNVEKDRIKASSSLDERNKYEYYLEPFRKAVTEGGAEAIMTAYNEINGVPAIVNGEVQRLVKDTWGLPGHVVCDGGDFSQTVNDHKYFESHAETLAYGLKAGVDCFTDDGKVVYAAAREALEKGFITEEDIDRSVRNSFRTRIRLGFFDAKGECPYTGMGEEYINSREHQEISRKMAQEAVVLLKNEGGLLPLDRKHTKSLAIVGPLADVWYKDWYCGIPPYQVTVLDGIKKVFPATEIMYHSGLSKIRLLCNGCYVGLEKNTSPSGVMLNEAGRLKLCKPEEAETFIFTDWGFGSTTLLAESVGKFVALEECIAEDTSEMGAGTEAIEVTERVRPVKEEAFGWFIREAWNFKPVKKVKTEGAQTENTEEAEKAGKECLKSLQGEFVLESWNGKEIGIDSNSYLIPIDGKISGGYQKAIFSMEVIEDGISEAQRLAENAEKAIVVIGCNPVINSKEEVDRTTLALPPSQEMLVKKVKEVNPNTVVVLLTNYPYAIGEVHKEVPAILCSASGSLEMGNGIGAVLSGEAVPAGRLPMTWYLSEKDLPDINDYDIINGKRTYQYFENEVLYPFGYGLSYTKFAYGAMEASLSADAVRVSVQVENVGSMKADEVVQLYVHKETSRVKQPICSLKGFERVKAIEPGESRTITFMVKYEDLRYYDVISRKMLLEEGVYTFMAGASSKDIRQSVSVKLQVGKIGSDEKMLVGKENEGEIPAEEIKVGKAPDRNPFVKTEGIQYDAYENCFIYRGEKGHTITGATCIIPGKAGKEYVNEIETIKGKAVYRDFIFERVPKEICIRICAVSAGTLCLSCTGERKEAVCRIPLEKSRDLEFIQIKYPLPDRFAMINEKQTLEIVLEGKIELADFVFM